MDHVIKIPKEYFNTILEGVKTFELRKNDRLYTVGDRLALFEIDENGNGTGNSATVKVTYILNGPCLGLAEDYCIMSVKRCGKQNRNASGNKPENEQQVQEYAQTIGKSAEAAKRFYNYYTMTGWKMKNGSPLADWKAALRNWKDFGSHQQNSDDECSHVALLLPILLRKTGDIYENFAELSFNDPHVGTIVKYFGLPHLKEPFNSFEIKEMVDRYFASKSLGTGIQILKTNARYGGKKTIIVPTLQEYAEIIKKAMQKTQVQKPPTST